MEVNKQDSSSEKILKRILDVESFINSYKEKNQTITKNIHLKTIFKILKLNRQIIQYEPKEFQSQTEITDTFKKIFKIQWDLIPKTNPLKTQEVIVTIDTIDWPYYGKIDNPYLKFFKKIIMDLKSKKIHR